MNDAALTLFIPFGSGYGNPGLTIRAETADELLGTFNDLSAVIGDPDEERSKLNDILDGVATINAGIQLKGLGVAKEERKAQPVTHPQAQANPESAKTCVHGAMAWKEGTSKAGKAYKGWFCTAPYGQQQCKAQFVN